MIGQALGLPTTMIAFSAMGVIITSAAMAILKGASPDQLWDPVFILSQLTSSTAPAGLSAPLIENTGPRLLVAVVALLGVGIATISVNIAANVVSPANDFANLAPRLISFKVGGLITGILGILMCPWLLLKSAGSYIFTWLVGYSALLGPIAGIMVVDYWLIRRTELDVPDLYRVKSRYGPLNPIAIAALVAGILPNVVGFLDAAGLRTAEAIKNDPNVFDYIYPYAWFIGFVLAGGIYFAGMRARPQGSVSANVSPT
jgi:nucleobase:cation symporter-1, NCS1 family